MTRQIKVEGLDTLVKEMESLKTILEKAVEAVNDANKRLADAEVKVTVVNTSDRAKITKRERRAWVSIDG